MCISFANPFGFRYNKTMEGHTGQTLGARLEAVLRMLPPCREVADIGTDHGLLCAEALARGVAERAVACDVSAASLSKARALIARRGLCERVRFAVADGFSGVELDGAPACGTGEASGYCAVLAGIGGELIAQILQRGGETPRKALRLVMQPMGGTAELRLWLHQNGYAVVDEAVARQGERYYQIIAARWDGAARGPAPCWEELAFGRIAYKKRERELPGLLEKTRRSRIRRLNQARRAGVSLPALEAELAAVERMIEQW